MERGLFKTRQWIQIALINFCVVALAGITLRYKINFPLPLVNQKYLLHAHSHFAFDGWVTLALMAMMVNYLQQQEVNINYKKYHWVLLANCVTAYGMFFSFILEGYAFFSITFSTISIFISYFFIYYLWRDLNKAKDQSYASKWFKAALVLWAISSLGAFTLAYLMANHIMVQDYYFGAIYFFLHFQYNGWFLFACFGLLFSYLYKKGFLAAVTISKKLFIMMAITVGPTYFLSILWLKLPIALHIIADVSGVLQLFVLLYFIRLFPLLKKNISFSFPKTTKYLWIMASIAFILKVILQMLSIIPFLSHYAFGFRPVVIGYLHLSFLGIITFFLLGYINQILSEYQQQISKTGVIIFACGVLIQEIILMCQGLEAIEVEPLPYANIILFYAAIAMGIGLMLITVRINNKKQFNL
ncbi:MAG: hypothetical protein ABI419_08400 [Ginsengibacter sp.]